MSKKKFGSNRQRVRCSGNQFDSSDLGHRYRMLGQQQAPPVNISGIQRPGPMQFHSAHSSINISNPNQFLIPTPHMWPAALNRNFVPTPQISTQNHFSLATPYMWATAPNPIFPAHQGAYSPFVYPALHPAHPPHQNRFALQPGFVPCHPYLTHQHPPYGRARPVSSRQHALHIGGIVPTDFYVPATSARQAGDTDNLALPFHARDPPTVQTPKEGCQCDASSLPREKDSEVTATSARQECHTDSTQNYSSPLAKAAVADKGPVASITADEKTANEKSRAPGLVASSRFVLHWPGVAEIAISKYPDSATSCELPTNESVFYEWWEVAPASSHPQSVLASLGLEVRESWDGLNLMLEGLSKSSDYTPSSPQSVLASKNLEKYSGESDVTETLFDRVALGNPSDMSCMSSLFDVGAELTGDDC